MFVSCHARTLPLNIAVLFAWRMVTTSELTNTGFWDGKTVDASAAGPPRLTSCAITEPVAFAVCAFGENSISLALSVLPSVTTVGSNPGSALSTTLSLGMSKFARTALAVLRGSLYLKFPSAVAFEA